MKYMPLCLLRVGASIMSFVQPYVLFSFLIGYLSKLTREKTKNTTSSINEILQSIR